MKQKKRRKRKEQHTALLPLVYFLNLKSFDPEQLKPLKDDAALQLYGHIFRSSPEELRDIHAEISGYVLAVTSPRKKRAQEAVKSVCEIVNAQPYFKPVWRVAANEEVEMEAALTAQHLPRIYLLALILQGCVDRDIYLLRCCFHCSEFFLAKHKRQTMFCRPEHARAYYDRPELAKERVYKSRDRRKLWQLKKL